MFESSSMDDFWCPLGEQGLAAVPPACDLTPEDGVALARLDRGDWISDVQIDRLESLGVIEKAFGQAVLTRFGCTVLAASQKAL